MINTQIKIHNLMFAYFHTDWLEKCVDCDWRKEDSCSFLNAGIAKFVDCEDYKNSLRIKQGGNHVTNRP